MTNFNSLDNLNAYCMEKENMQTLTIDVIENRIIEINANLEYFKSVGQKYGGNNPMLDWHFELEKLNNYKVTATINKGTT